MSMTHFPNGIKTSVVVGGSEESLHFEGGEITEDGEMGIGTYPPPGLYPLGGLHPAGTGWGPDAPEAQLRIGGVYTTDSPVIFNIQNIFRPGPVMLPHFGGTLNMMAVLPYLEPTIVGTVNTIVGAAIYPNLAASATNITTLIGVGTGWAIKPDYTGTITAAYCLQIDGFTNQGVNKYIQEVRGISIGGLNTNQNITTGIATQFGIIVGSISSSANGGTNNNYGIGIQVPSGIAALGTVNNRGLYISGTGGTATGGVVNNFAIYSTSPAPSLFTGPIIQMPAALVTPVNNGELMIQATSNTQITIKLKGSDGVVRSSNLTFV